jgi:hypothetical protein
VSSPLVIAPRKQEVSKPRLFSFSMVTDERLEELLIITIFVPFPASFSTEISTTRFDITLQHKEAIVN